MSVSDASLSRTRVVATPSLVRGFGMSGLAFIAVVVGFGDVVAGTSAGLTGIGPPLSRPSAAFPFGTDLLGRDMASETLHGLAVTVDGASVAMLIVLLVGALAGYAAAQLPHRLGGALRALARVFCLVPPLFLAILLIGMSDRGWVAVAAGLAASPAAFARAFDRATMIARSAHADYAALTGIPASALLRRDLVYEFRAGFLTTASRALAAVTITLSTASFFGFGATPPHRDLGLIIASAREIFLDAWWTVLFPGLALAFLVLCARLTAGLEEGERP